MSFLEYFSANYREARSKFLTATEQAAAELEAIENPALAPDGKSVFTDVARLGEHAAKNVLLVNSATHGVEGFCGSAACVGWLRSDASRALPEGVRAILVHAMNPHGFAWLRRVTEDNVDLNRNFVDHDRTPPPNDEYDRLHPVVLPENWDSASQAKCKETFDRYVDRHGMFALQTVLSRGQYAHPDGLFFGGNAPTWSNRQFRSILDRFVVGAKRLVFLDFHTGLGPYGSAELIGDVAPGMKPFFTHGLTSPSTGNSSSPALSGMINCAIRQAVTNAEVTSLTVEFGTYAVAEMLQALQADNWLHLRGDLDSALGETIKRNVRKRFYPDEDDWKELVWVRSRQVLRHAIDALARP
jgi:hypothetical protein